MLEVEGRCTAAPPLHSRLQFGDGGDPLDVAVQRRDLGRTIEVAWERYAPRLLFYFRCRGLPLCEAQELVQGVFASVVEGWSNFDGRCFRGWLWSYARFSCLDALRARERRQEIARTPEVYRRLLGQAAAEPDIAADLRSISELLIAALEPIEHAVFLATVCLEMRGREVSDFVLDVTGTRLSDVAIRKRRSRMKGQIAALRRDWGGDD